MDGIDDALAQRRLRAMVHERLFGTPAAPLQIGRYRVIRRLGVGAMGVVYAARDQQLGRLVAVKVLHGHLDGDLGEARARLLREARALARVHHPAVVAIHEVGTHDGQIFLAMEYVAGVTLGAWIRDARPGWRAIVAAFVAAGRGLQAAHAAGLVHRDFKPDNVLVDGTGRARVLDFGLVGADAAQASVSVSSGDGDELGPLTRSGVIVGTPAYMSPEQLRGEVLDPRSDLFSFCVALHEALLGHRPFDLLHEAGLRGAALGTAQAPGGPPRPVGHRLPRRLRRALERGLERARERRFPAMEPLLRELEACITPALQRWEPRIAAFVGVAALAGLVAVGARGDATSSGGSPVLPRVAHLRLVGEHARVRSADEAVGREVIRSGRDRRRIELAEALVAVDPSAAARVLGGLEAPDRVADDPGLARLVDAIQGEPLTIAEAWAPADAQVAVAGGRFAWILEGGAVSTIDLELAGADRRPRRRREHGVVALAVADDAAFLARADGAVERWIHGADAAERCASPGPAIVDLQARGAHAAWLRADGTIMVHDADAGTRLWTTVPGAEALALSPGAARIAVRRGATFEILGGRASVRVDHPGATRFAIADAGALATAADDGALRIWSAAGRRLATLEIDGGAGPFAWSPRGDRLAIAAGDTIRSWDPQKGENPPLRGHHGRIRAIAWAGDDALLSGDEGGGVRLWSLPRGRAEALLRGHRASIVGVEIDGDGDAILTHSADGELRRWRASGAVSTILERRDRDLSAIALHPRSARRVSAGADGILHLWSDAEGVAARPPDHRIRCGAAIQALALGATWVAGGDARGRLCLLRWAGDGPPEAVDANAGPRGRAITALAIDEGERWLAIGDSDGGVRLVDLAAPTARARSWRRARRGGAWIMSLSFETGGSRLLAASADGDIVIGAPQAAPERVGEPSGGLQSAVWGASAAAIDVAGDDGWIRVLHLDPGAPVRDERIGHHPAVIWDLARAPDGSHLASAGADGRIGLWPRGPGARGTTFSGHRGEVLDLAFEAGGDHLISVGEDGSARRWPLRLVDRLGRLAAVAEVCVEPAIAQALDELGGAARPPSCPR